MLNTKIKSQSKQKTTNADSLEVIVHKEQNIPGSAKFTIDRYYAQQPKEGEDTGTLIYNYSKDSKENFIELKFITTQYQNIEDAENKEESVNSTIKTVDVFNFHFTSTFLHQFSHNVKVSSKKDEILAFKHQESFTKTFHILENKKSILTNILNNELTGALENIYINAKIHELLLFSLDTLFDEKQQGYTCKFLEDEHSRDAVYASRDILLKNIGNPLTIKELSRKVAINECYLKKGFKEIFGTTIFDFYQQQRMEHAKYLLYEKEFSVTDVSALLGYSSISHFSAAFKKHTGSKPCDLLK